MPSTKRVILLVESSAAYGRGCLRGIARYALAHGNWILQHMPHNLMRVLDLGGPWKVKAQGVIARISTQRVVSVVRKLALPTVDIMGAVPMKGVAVVDSDHARIMQLAVDHLVSNGLEHIAYCGFPGLQFSDTRQRAFADSARPESIRWHTYPSPRRSWRGSDSPETPHWPRDLRSLQKWLVGLPKPVGIVACNDTRARHVLEVCEAVGIDVPQDVSVVGVDNDDVICELCTPPVTSVDPNVEAIGVEAARVLDRMMGGGTPPRRTIGVPPLGIEPRASSDTRISPHDDLNEAVRFIRSNVAAGINVGSVVAHVGTSRSTLERRFREHMGCSPHEYIHRHRMERVKRLVLNTYLPAYRIAQMSGFRSSAHMIAVFREHTGMTPGQFRRRYSPTP